MCLLFYGKHYMDVLAKPIFRFEIISIFFCICCLKFQGFNSDKDKNLLIKYMQYWSYIFQLYIYNCIFEQIKYF